MESRHKITFCSVTFRTSPEILKKSLESIQSGLSCLPNLKSRLFIVDNSEPSSEPSLDPIDGLDISIQSGHGNIGFGCGNNLVMDHVGDYHLVLNPDVEIAPDALEKALAFMEAHPECGLLTPLAYGTDGKRQFLCKRFPAVLDLALRGFAPGWLQQLFKTRLDRYQMAEISEDAVFWNPPIVSGCFMLFRGDVFKALNGFDPDYFLYFEDFDLSLRTGRISRIAFVPQVRIIHGGGYASRKGAWHIWQFVKSGLTFYRKFGLKLW